MRTVFGDIEVELFDQDKPATVRNFIRYVESGRWQDMFIHRCVPGFVVQGGGYRVLDAGTLFPRWGVVESFASVPNEFAIGRRFSNLYGTLAMAKLPGQTNSATCEWFLNLRDNVFLDAEDTTNLFTVFGRVVRGTNVLEVFNRFGLTWPTNILADLSSIHPAFPLFPLLSVNGTFADLVYVDVTLLRVDVEVTPAGANVSWNSVAGVPQVVEFTRGFPPVWENHSRTIGSGARMTVLDPAARDGFRFYRVRVDYGP
jgi:cyclophilin family peptidyl-prolyl cis-trans isomerase